MKNSDIALVILIAIMSFGIITPFPTIPVVSML